MRFQIRGGARRCCRALLFTAAAVAAVAATLGHHAAAQAPAFTYQHVMVPVRDGVRLETVIMAPTDAAGPLPILVRRTPYGVPASAAIMSSPALKDFVRDGYIFVVQNLRGRFLSEGTFELSAKGLFQTPPPVSDSGRSERARTLAGRVGWWQDGWVNASLAVSWALRVNREDLPCDMSAA